MSDSFETFDPDDIEGIVNGAHVAGMATLEGIFSDLKAEIGGPGLAWSQIEYVLKMFKEKRPQIIRHPQTRQQ